MEFTWFDRVRRILQFKQSLNVRKNKSINQFLRCDFRYSGGWTVIQHRFDGSVDFNKDWAAYETGFGQAQSEYWLGLEHITKLSNSADTRIRIDLTDFQGHKAYVEHENFFVSDTDDNYR